MAQRNPLSPTIRIHGINKELFDAVDAEVQAKNTTKWKRVKAEVTYFAPGKFERDNESITVDFHPTNLATYERFEGEEDNADEVYWKEGKLGNVSVTMFKPDSE